MAKRGSGAGKAREGARRAAATHAASAPRRSETLTLVADQRALRDLALLVSLGLEVVETVAEAYGEAAPEVTRRAAAELYGALARAWQGPMPLIAEENGKLSPVEIIQTERDRLLDDYDNDAFWRELEERLAERDFARVATDEERTYVREHSGELPASADRLFERWRHELDAHGVDRLVLDPKAIPAPSLAATPPSPNRAARVRKVFTALVVARFVRANRKRLADLTDADKRSIAELAASHLEVVPEALLWSLAGNENAGAVIDALGPFLPRL
ncbi:MAG TPA: hypothetical protein VJJ47_03805 [Candidatus Paceibacterota bacterium]